MPAALDKSPTYFRTSPARGPKRDIEREGGDMGAGLIEGVSILTRGEAEGHGEWIDDEFLLFAQNAINKSARGAKVRFTHPDLSNDGLGKYLGRAKDAYIEGGQLRADIHFSRAAHNTPDGDLADYLMNLADEDPDSFGVSIAFTKDRKAQELFERDHADPEGRFVSPDPANRANLPHVRGRKLHAADVVDQPAANPDGLWHHPANAAAQADELARYALGLTDEPPVEYPGNIHPDRFRGFVSRFLQSHQLEIREATMSDDKTPADDQKDQNLAADQADDQNLADPTVPEPTPAVDDQGTLADPTVPEPTPAVKTDGARFLERWGTQGGVWFAEGKSYEEAAALHYEALEARVAELEKENEELRAHGDDDDDGPIPLKPRDKKKPTGLASVVRIKK